MNPEELMAQIRDLLDQYLAMGAGTPVEAEAQALAAAIDSTMGGGGGEPDMMPPESGMPPEGGEMPTEMPMMGGEVGMPDMTGGLPLDQMQEGGFTDFGSARSALEEDIKKKIKAR